ncbi:MAG: alpha-glucosidase C-terminal domain-containing protein [Candidatus Marinimicrobia bacterium]|nr:alpha-glucosidase C-terminal domain-containing protein [Candidatus Neomarinimicrobiota bacterium]
MKKIIAGNPAIFTLLRTSPSNTDTILCLYNVSAEAQKHIENGNTINLPGTLQDFLSGQRFSTTGQQCNITLKPYKVLWLHFVG